jgi:predicted Zn-ribbon and HTH transcriptional regulator
LTRREEIIELLLDSEFNSKDLADYFDVGIKVIVNDIDHIQKSLRRKSDKQILVKPAKCVSCDFTFKSGSKIKDPKKCPKCHSERIIPRYFKIEKK